MPRKQKRRSPVESELIEATIGGEPCVGLVMPVGSVMPACMEKFWSDGFWRCLQW